MQSSHSSSSASVKRYVVPAVTWLLRLVTGGVFIYSGFVKAVDPWGTFYKFGEYFAAMGLPQVDSLTLVAVFALFTLEFLIGVFLVLGCYRRSAPVMALVFMAVMLPLTLWIAVADPVADCGCFGDALVISNWQTFWKNVVLTAFAIWLLYYNRKCRCLITPAFQWMAFIASGMFAVAVGLFGYLRQPLVDFRAYPEGSSLLADSEEGPGEPEFIFIYEKDGMRKEFTADDVLPDETEGWRFVERKEKAVPTATEEESDERSLRIWDRSGDEDVTDDVVLESGDQLLLMMPDLSKVSTSTTWKINSLHDWAAKHGIDMIAVVSGTGSDINEWEDLSMPGYPIYTADDTAVKEVVRGNPGVVYLRDGVIAWKSTLDALDADDFMSADRDYDPMEFRFDSRRALLNCFYVYLAVMAVLIVLSFTPRMIRRFGK